MDHIVGKDTMTKRILFVSNYGRELYTSFQYALIKNMDKYGLIVDHLYPKDGPLIKQISQKKIQVPDAVIFMEGLLFQNPDWLKLPVNIPKIWWFLDADILFNEQVAWYNITKADYALVKNKRDLTRFRENGVKCEWAPYRIDNTIFKPYNLERDIDIGFVGYINKTRANWLESFTKVAKNVHGYGDGNIKPYKTFNCNIYPEKIHHDEIAKIYSRTKICPHRTGRYEDSGTIAKGIQGDITWRPFEAMACGAMVLTEPFDALDDLWVRGKEIVVHRLDDDKERLDLAKYYLEHDDERNKIAKAGYDRTVKDWTWNGAIDQIIRVISRI